MTMNLTTTGAAGDDDLANMTPNQRSALNKGLAALETMAALWGAEVSLTRLAWRIAAIPNESERAARIAAMIEQGFIEGAYRHYLDNKDAIAALEAKVASGGDRDAEFLRTLIHRTHACDLKFDRAGKVKALHAIFKADSEPGFGMTDGVRRYLDAFMEYAAIAATENGDKA
jgi:hypothetical protein